MAVFVLLAYFCNDIAGIIEDIKMELAKQSAELANSIREEELFPVTEDLLTSSSFTQPADEVKRQMVLKKEVRNEVEQLSSQISYYRNGKSSFEIDPSQSFFMQCSDPVKLVLLSDYLGTDVLQAAETLRAEHVKCEYGPSSVGHTVPTRNDNLSPLPIANSVSIAGSLKGDKDFSETLCEDQFIMMCQEVKSHCVKKEEESIDKSPYLKSTDQNFSEEEESCFVKEEEELTNEDPVCLQFTDQNFCEEEDPFHCDPVGECLKESVTENDTSQDSVAGSSSCRYQFCGKLASLSPNHSTQKEGTHHTTYLKSMSLHSDVSKETSVEKIQKLKYTHNTEGVVYDKISTYKQNMRRCRALLHKSAQPCKCNVCGKTFVGKVNLNAHMLVHKDVCAFKCGVCDAEFKLKENFNRHMLEHNNICPFKCEICDKAFTQRVHLDCHILLHQNIRAFLCGVCGQAFFQRVHLHNHMLIHQNTHAFKCEVCEKAFTQKGTLNTHMLIHKNIDVFKCEECGREFSHRGNFNRHMLLHNYIHPFQCELCERVFKCTASLKAHMSVHANNACIDEVCDKELVQKGKANTHIVNKNSNAFKCKVCDRAFKLKAHLFIHKHLCGFNG